jgi:AcrR family transcriptional regulator
MKVSSLRSRLREATSGAILEAAEEVFAERGLSAAHMNDIATRAGVAVGTLYNHFKDRDALLAALIEMRRAGLCDVMDEFLNQPSSGNFRTDLSALMHRMGGYFERHRRYHTILHRLEYDLSRDTYPQSAACGPEMKRQMHIRLEKLIKRGLKQKALRPELTDFYPTLLLGILRSMKMRLTERGSDERLPIDAAIGFFMEGAGA